MNEKIKNLMFYLIGNPKKSSLEHRLFNSISLVNGVINILGSFGTFYLPNFLILFTLSFVTGILFLFFYYLSRFKNIYYALFWPFNLTILFYLSINWITNGGSIGGSHYYLIPALVIATILLRTHNLYFVYSIYILVTILLFGIEFFKPEVMTLYKMDQDRYLDAGGNYVFILILTGILIFILSKNLDLERKKSDNLLLNILPEKIALELKENDKVIPKYYESVSVIFTDMAGFTKIAEKLKPDELVSMLDHIFSEFDKIIKKHNIEKIKTIGDAYMCAGGIPTENFTHAFDAVSCAVELNEYMRTLKIKKEKSNEPFFELRIGVHSGPIIAGVIGKEKFAFDIWGDTVNTASRMESSGIIGEVNISKSTYDLIKDKFICEYRGKVNAKNKGEIDMYLVKSS